MVECQRSCFWIASSFLLVGVLLGGVPGAESPTTRPNHAASGSLITLHFKASKPRDVFASLSKQIGYELRPDPVDLWDRRDWPAIDLDVDKVPFWDAMGVIVGKAGCDISAMPGGFYVRRSDWEGQTRCAQGPVIAIDSPCFRDDSSDIVGASNAPDGRNRTLQLNVQLQMDIEPDVLVFEPSHGEHVIAAIDDRGGVLALHDVTTERTCYSNGNPNHWSMQFEGDRPFLQGTRFLRMTDRVSFAVATSVHHCEIYDPLHAHDVVLKSTLNEVEFQKVVSEQGRYRVFFEAANNSASERAMVKCSTRDLKLFDTAGNNCWEPHGKVQHPAWAKPNEFLVDFYPRADSIGATAGPPAKLIWSLPNKVENVTQSLEFAGFVSPPWK